MWIKDVINQLTQIKDLAQQEFTNLTEEELLWKPSPQSWSIAECLQHIIIANRLYLRDINKKIEKAEIRTIEYPIRLSLMGRIFLLFVDPQYKWKVKAPKIFKPINKNKVENAKMVLQEYLALQEDIILTAKKAIGYDHSNIFTISPLSKLIRFNIGEQFYIMARHEKRHLNQAERVKSALKSVKKTA